MNLLRNIGKSGYEWFYGFYRLYWFIGFTGSLGYNGLVRSLFITFPGSTTPHEELAHAESTRVPEVQLINTQYMVIFTKSISVTRVPQAQPIDT